MRTIDWTNNETEKLLDNLNPKIFSLLRPAKNLSLQKLSKKQGLGIIGNLVVVRS